MNISPINLYNAQILSNVKYGKTSCPKYLKGLEYDTVSFSGKKDMIKSTGNPELDKIIADYASFDKVRAIAIGGSSSSKKSDKLSDIDLYVFLDRDFSLEERKNFVKSRSDKYEVGGDYFGAGDEYFANKLGQEMDVMYWTKNWFWGMVNDVWNKNQASNGYTTSFLHSLKNFNIVCDKDGWLEKLKGQLYRPYPDELQKNIITRNLMLMYDKPFSSYYEQMEKAQKRNDTVNFHNRLSAFMDSYFDCIFAMNKVFNPGEKRLVQYAKQLCSVLPNDFEDNIEKLYSCPDEEKLNVAEDMIVNLKCALAAENLL